MSYFKLILSHLLLLSYKIFISMKEDCKYDAGFLLMSQIKSMLIIDNNF